MNSFAKELRRNMTDAERLLWQKLRNRNLIGYKFRRQHPVQHYIVDFVCLEKMLIIEVDGGQHGDRQAYDQKRTLVLQNLGFRVIRFWNNEVLQETGPVLEKILMELNK